ncbi:energy transducer TonB [Erythrobacter mangrovi]|uniref:Energy transducer TonB n=2 Tax=Erythrobacter mangrovi TaxID=2739433 RepID=A0A7D4BCA2_9SPHN|nr:energy transducer TonB [Erythrobacter mangrovi]
MAAQTLRHEERIGLAVAAVLHVALVGVLLLQPANREAIAEPQRMTVSLAEDVGLEATAPDPVPESRAATAPTLSDAPVPAPAIPQTEQRVAQPPTPSVRPPVPAPTARPDSRERRRPDPSRTQAAQSSSQRSGGSRLSDNFLEGSGSSSTTTETRIPASQIGPSAKASVVQALIRQIRPHWSAPQGVDAEMLVTELDFDLNEDGSLRGAPRIRAQSGVTDSNRPQQSLHAERAIRAVQLAAPFKLPPEYYNAWKSIRGARFDRNLSR